MTMSDREVEYRGLPLNDGATYAVQSVEGLLGAPDIRSSDRPRLLRHGLHAGRDWLGARTITLSLDVVGWDEASFGQAVSDLAAAFLAGQEDAGTLRFRIPGVAGGNDARVSARVRAWSLPVTDDYIGMAATASVQLVATDPRIYADVADVGALGLYAPPGGLTFPLTFPLVFGSVGSFGSLSAHNVGNMASPPTIRIDGPVTNPAITNYRTGQTIALAIVLAAGEWLDIDVADRTVLLNGTANRYSYLTSAQWWNVEPGWNEIRYTAAVTTASTATLTFRSAWA